MATVAALLSDAVARLGSVGLATPRLDAELLLAGVLGIDRTGVIAHPEAPVGEGQATEYGDLVRRRAAGEPVAYLRGVREFMSLAFVTDSRALIPRPETERLVEAAEAEIARRLVAAPRPPGAARLRIVDVGTGGGAIAVALAVRLRARRMIGEVDLLATDDDAEALELATENAVGHAVADVVRFARADLVPPDERPFDVVVANLPYVATGELDALADPIGFEPPHALDGGPDGLAVVGRLVGLLPDVLGRDGVALLEIGAGQEAGTASLAAALPGPWSCTVARDYAGRPRVARIERAAPAAGVPAAPPAAGS